jgi:hypothetical protein
VSDLECTRQVVQGAYICVGQVVQGAYICTEKVAQGAHICAGQIVGGLYKLVRACTDRTGPSRDSAPKGFFMARVARFAVFVFFLSGPFS